MERTRILEREIRDILDFFKNIKNISTSRNINHLGLLSGLSGLIAVLFDSQQKFPNLIGKFELRSYLQKTFEILDENETILASYCDGLAGYGFLILKLKKSKIFFEENDKELLPYIDDLLYQIDDVLEDQLDVFFNEDNYDLLHGALGVGIYFIERDNIESVLKLVDRLESSCYIEGEQIFWKKYDKYKNHTTVIDLGSSHGNASILYFLSKTLTIQPYNKVVKKLIKGNLIFYMQNTQVLDEHIYSYYPSFIKAHEFEEKRHLPENSRLAWCYGDLGTLYMLLLASCKIDGLEIYAKVLEKLQHVAKRRITNENYVIDSGFCHGTSGIAIIFNKIFKITNDAVFLDTAKYWIDQTLKSKYSSNSIPLIGYSFPIEATDEHNFSLLEGLPGVLYCYMDFISDDTILTDETLFLKL